MRYNLKSAGATSATALVALIGSAAAQHELADSEAPFIGGGLYNSSYPSLAGFTLQYKPPFKASNYGGYYTWAVNNNTVGINNNTAQTDPLGIPNTLADNTVYPFFVVNEGTQEGLYHQSERR